MEEPPSNARSRWRRVSAVLADALERPPEARSAYLDRACASDEPLRREVEGLLAREGQAEEVLGASAAALAGPLLDASGGEGDEAALEGRRVGPYHLLRLLGRGGMGAVYLARRADTENLVAFKTLRAPLLSLRRAVPRGVPDPRPPPAPHHRPLPRRGRDGGGVALRRHGVRRR